MTAVPRATVWVLSFFIAASPSLLRAQAAPARTAAQAGDSTVVLSAFQVNTDKDRGYQAVDSLIGGRIATELMKTPSDVTVLTKEFLDDIGATSYLDAGPYLTNAVVPDRTQLSADTGDGINFRGVAGGVSARNYFRHANSTDFYIVERLEGSRGPNAILFGDGVLGGVVNTTTKRARFGDAIASLSVRADSEGSLRGSVDVNRQLGPAAAVRVNLLRTDERNWIQTYYNNREGAHLALTFRPWKGGEFRAEGEYGKLKRGRVTTSFADQSSNWNGVPVTSTASAPAGATGLTRFTADRLVISPSLGNTPLNFLGLAFTTGSVFAVRPEVPIEIPRFPSVPRGLAIQPPNIFATNRYVLGGVYYEHQWSDRLVGELAFQSTYFDRGQEDAFFGNYRLDPNRTMPNGTPNPKFGQPFADSNRNIAMTDVEQIDYRAALAYTLPVKAWDQRINLMATRRIERTESRSDRWARANHPTTPDLQAAVNQLFYHVYLLDPVVALADPIDDATYRWAKYRVTHNREEKTLDSVQIATVAQFWDRRLSYVGGVRRDEYDSWQTSVATRTTQGQPLTFGKTDVDSAVTKFSSGATFFPVPQVGAYANYSQTFNTVAAGFPSIYGEAFGPTEGEGYSAGLRFNLLSGRVVGSVGYYDSQEKNRIAPAALTGITEINRIWTNLLKSQNTFVGFRDTTDYFASGYELDVVANLTKSFRLRGNFARPKTELTNSIPGLRRYFNQHIAEWQAAASNPATQGQSSVVTDIFNLRTRINSSVDHRRLDGSPDYTGSVFGNYTFSSGWLNRLRAGLGATVTGPLLLGNQTNLPFAYIKSEPRFLGNAALGYTARIANRKVNVQLNVSNLLDDSDPVFTGVRGAANGTIYTNTFYYNEPRKFVLTVTLDL